MVWSQGYDSVYIFGGRENDGVGRGLSCDLSPKWIEVVQEALALLRSPERPLPIQQFCQGLRTLHILHVSSPFFDHDCKRIGRTIVL